MAEQSLADYLGVGLPTDPKQEPTALDAVDVTDPKAFAEAVLGSREFRRFVVDGLLTGELAPGIITRLMDHAWGVPPKKLELTGKDGQPIVTEVRRVIVRAPLLEDEDAPHREVTH